MDRETFRETKCRKVEVEQHTLLVFNLNRLVSLVALF
jgi:hypothetical protein